MKIQTVKSAQTNAQVKAQVKATPGAVKRVNKMPKRQRGNAILFTLLALVIGGVIISVGISQYQDAERAVSIQSTISEVNTIIGTAKQNYGQYRYEGLTTAAAVSGRVIPQELRLAAATAQNKFRGAVTLDAAAAAIVNGTQGIVDHISVGGAAVKLVGGVMNAGALATVCNADVGGVVAIAWTFGRS
jgi:hypothetical protein